MLDREPAYNNISQYRHTQEEARSYRNSKKYGFEHFFRIYTPRIVDLGEIECKESNLGWESHGLSS